MSDPQDLGALAGGLRMQQLQLWAVIERLEHSRRALAPSVDELRWRGPAHATYLAARWAFDRELASALDALRAARDSTETALETLANRG